MSLPFQKPKNKSRRSREFLTEAEVNKMISVARNIGRHGDRDAAMILIAFRHGLRVSELISLRWQQVDLKSGLLQVHRLKNGLDSVHPLFGPELRALRKRKAYALSSDDDYEYDHDSSVLRHRGPSQATYKKTCRTQPQHR